MTHEPKLQSTRPMHRRAAMLSALLALVAGAALPAGAADSPALDGVRTVRLHGRDGSAVALGTVRFTPQPGGRSAFALRIDSTPLQDHFLSMREFKCLPGQGEILCHVPYPYPQPGTVAPGDMGWLEHSLLFMFKTPSEFGAKLWNGIYFPLVPTATGWAGRPQAIDLNRISAPPDKPGVLPYPSAQRDEVTPGARWFERLTIE